MGYNPLANTLVAPDCASKYGETPQKRIVPGLSIDVLDELVRCSWQTMDLQVNSAFIVSTNRAGIHGLF